MKKILVVDDDDTVRLFLQRLLTKKFMCQVLEAKDGLEGLSIIQSESPNLVIMDVRMPVIDGTEMLEAIRSDPVHSGLAVIVTTVVSDKTQVARLIMLGISGYILKPLWSEIVYRKVYEVLSKTKNSDQGEIRMENDSPVNDKEKILVVDKDLNFRTFFQTVLGGRFDIDEVETGIEALTAYTVHHPRVVCLGENLSLLNERLLARKIRQIDANQRTEIFLLAESDRTNDTTRELFHGVIRKSFVPDIFVRDFTRIVLNEESVYDTVVDMLNKHLPFDLRTATQQTFGVMSTQEVQVLGDADVKTVSDEVCATVDLTEDQQKFSISVGLVGSQADVLILAEKILGSSVQLNDGATDAFGEIVNTISGRIRSSIQTRGVKMNQGTPVITLKKGQIEQRQWKLTIPFRTDEGQKYLVGLDIVPLQKSKATS